MRGIASGVDILWGSDSEVLREINFTTAIMMNNSQVYTDSYTITQLSTSDNGRVIGCEIIIMTIPSIVATNNVTLDVTGKYCKVLSCLYKGNIHVHECHFLVSRYLVILMNEYRTICQH